MCPNWNSLSRFSANSIKSMNKFEENGNLRKLRDFFLTYISRTYGTLKRPCRAAINMMLIYFTISIEKISDFDDSEELHNVLFMPGTSWQPCQTSKMEVLKTINYVCKRLHLRYLTDIQIRLFMKGWWWPQKYPSISWLMFQCSSASG